MSGNTLTHPTDPAVQNLPTAVKLALANYGVTTNVPTGNDYAYWQGQADAASICVYELDCAADGAFAERNFDLVEQIQALADLHACQLGHYDQIRPITLKRGLIVGAPVPVPAMRAARTPRTPCTACTTRTTRTTHNHGGIAA